MDLEVDLEKFFMGVDIADEKKFAVLNHIGEEYGVFSELCEGIEQGKESIRKRKKECYLPMLDWVKNVAKNPCDPAIGEVPERPKWKAYGSDHVWKKVLLAKEAMRSNFNVDLNAKQSIWKKKLKMHPDMYDEPTKKATSRCSQRLISAKETRTILLSKKQQFREFSESSSTGSRSDIEDEESFWVTDYKKKRIPLGRQFQAEIPELTEDTYEYETKWLGTRVWPLEESEKRSGLIERERIGKGKQESCGCELTGSIECVRFHVSEKRLRVKLELGSAFVKWKFDTMGEEEVSLKWTRKEEKKFAEIIKSTPESTGTSFWDPLMDYFKNKSKGVLVGYYFNVYLLRRRAHQNRMDPGNVDSDDDELEKVGREISNKSMTGSILCSPKKVIYF